ncbi:acyltransferase family protein [Tenacibaculum sp. MEBiC06402]|uniref:acyltransferase family protein n=1 Tax=unclassified Tenacibaculum TaxID=2635139 RepID=UPI003B9DA144
MIINRRYDLDWLRVISVFTVFVHHVCMPFNGDDFHIMNSESSKFLDDIMVYFEQFRLPLLFFISGVGTVFAFSKRNWFQFIKERSLRLLIPLVFGVLVLIPPQTYFENYIRNNSFLESYLDILSNLNVNHLWFIENLFWMSIFVIPLIIFLKSSVSNKVKVILKIMSSKYGVFSWCLVLILGVIISKYYFPTDSKSIFNLSSTFYYGFFFISGILIASTESLWLIIYESRRKYLYLTFFTTVLFYFYYFLPSEIISPYVTVAVRWNIWYMVCAMLGWSVILVTLGYGQKYFNHNSLLLKNLNEAVYPFYMLHQTVIIVVGYYVLQMSVSIFLKIVLLFCSSLIFISLLYYVIIYPFNFMRFLFGMKKAKKKYYEIKNTEHGLN